MLLCLDIISIPVLFSLESLPEDITDHAEVSFTRLWRHNFHVACVLDEQNKSNSALDMMEEKKEVPTSKANVQNIERPTAVKPREKTQHSLVPATKSLTLASKLDSHSLWMKPEVVNNEIKQPRDVQSSPVDLCTKRPVHEPAKRTIEVNKNEELNISSVLLDLRMNKTIDFESGEQDNREDSSGESKSNSVDLLISARSSVKAPLLIGPEKMSGGESKLEEDSSKSDNEPADVGMSSTSGERKACEESTSKTVAIAK